MSDQVVLVEEPAVYRSSPDYGGLLFNRTYPAVLSTPFFALRDNKLPWTLFESPYVSVYSVLDAYSRESVQPKQSVIGSFPPSSRLEEPEWDRYYLRVRHASYFELVRLYAAQLVGFTSTVPDLCDDPWLEWVHPPASPESAIYPFRQINTFIRGQQYNLFFDTPKPWKVEAEEDTVSRLANYGIALPYARPAVALLMPDVLGLPVELATDIIVALSNLPLPNITYQSTVFPIPPIPKGIVIGQYPLPFQPLTFPFYTLLVVSTGLMLLPKVGDSTNYSPVNIVIADDTPP